NVSERGTRLASTDLWGHAPLRLQITLQPAKIERFHRGETSPVDTTLRITPERFREGITISQFYQQMQKNRETFRANFEGFTVSPEDAAFLQALKSPLNVLVLAEDWCGAVVRYL